jgi:hypothetical protein
MASEFESSGTSRMDGAETGWPPYEEMIEAISFARRLSRLSTRRLSKEGAI